MLELIVLTLSTVLVVAACIMLAMLAIGEMALALGAHVPGHRKLGRAFVFVAGFMVVTLVCLVIIRSF